MAKPVNDEIKIDVIDRSYVVGNDFTTIPSAERIWKDDKNVETPTDLLEKIELFENIRHRLSPRRSMVFPWKS